MRFISSIESEFMWISTRRLSFMVDHFYLNSSIICRQMNISSLLRYSTLALVYFYNK